MVVLRTAFALASGFIFPICLMGDSAALALDLPARTTGKDGAWMVLIPGGTFKMGSPAPSGTGDDDEQPVHDVTLSPYTMDVYETTNRLYRKCVEAGVCTPPDRRMSYDDPRYADHPVVSVDWVQAQTYCAWAGKRLPTEAEWEFAARGPQSLNYPWGDRWDPSRANWNGGENGDGTFGTKPAGSYPSGASPFGLHDMAGNVWEWCADWHKTDSYEDHEKVDPRGPRFGSLKVLRGGGWNGDGKETLRGANRFMDRPFEAYSLFGFRCAATPPGVPPPDPKTTPEPPSRDEYEE